MSIVLPILFNTEMVRAILDGKKTVTRRLVKKSQCINLTKKEPFDYLLSKENMHAPYNDLSDEELIASTYKPPYKQGDILYVRETWSTKQSNECIGSATGRCPYDNCETATGPCFGEEYIYKATDCLESSVRRWHPSIHMPKEAARIWLKVTDVRAECLQDMNTDDFLTEGVVIRPEAYNDPDNLRLQAREEFRIIWDSTIRKSDLGRYGWASNPWVWVIEFERSINGKSI